MRSYLNKLTRKSIVAGSLVIALASSSGFVYAHNAMNQDRLSDRFDYIFTQLNLTDDQGAATLDIFQKQMSEMREQHHASREAGAERHMAEQRQAMQASAHTALADALGTVLQADQIDGLMTYLDAHQPRGGKGMRGGHHGSRHQSMEQSQPSE
jgi:Spy/CpxP family protein refolding chaperone